MTPATLQQEQTNKQESLPRSQCVKMKSQSTMICCLMLFLTTECSQYRAKIHIKDGDKHQHLEEKPKTGRIQEKCHGPCITSSNCSQPCAHPFRGEIGFTCNQNMWQKSTETCTSLSVRKLFQDVNSASRLSVAAPLFPLRILDFRAPEPMESVVQGIRRSCPQDYACIIDAVKSSEATSGNIAFIVELLKNISTDLSDNVTREKMKSYSEVANHILDTAAISNWAFIPDRNASSDLLQSVNSFARQLHLRNASENIVDEPFIQTKGLMSFSILMSPISIDDKILDYITCIGLSVSILSLVLCLLIEATVWSRVVVTEISYMRHVCIVNIAVSLLTANVWFIISSNFSKKAQDHNWCIAMTFFSHFFYLSLFFWMLFKALLIIYGILVVFHRMMKSRMMAIGFVIGYGFPLIIAGTTVAITMPEKGYMRHDACWLNWDNTKALLAFAIPALVIVAVNLLVVLVVAVNTQRPFIGSSKSQDVAIIRRISKNVAILTPLLGLTWGFGVATLIKGNSLIFHIIFALLNAFQGFFILLFGTIMDHKIRDALRMKMSSLKGPTRVAENASLSPTNGSKLMNR
ncbi:adhesion G protein-coupled receptor F4 [Myotis lucifugus]|uniref:adhesion G protein-coupled receptor F4 n=1 Tax=Myotis lucifugus TaxID=59463 RepID=UPI0006D7246B|nr:adhesion G protein-coupled receptor F4 [Myotis lucifugus]